MLDSVQFWVVLQILMDAVLLVLVLFFLKGVKAGLKDEAVAEVAKKVIGLLEPILREAEATAATFEEQLKEKAQLVRSINEQLDNRIIGLNLLLNRASAQAFDPDVDSFPKTVFDQQAAILKLYGEQCDPDEIASRLSLPRGEVDLVIDLKRKFAAFS